MLKMDKAIRGIEVAAPFVRGTQPAGALSGIADETVRRAPTAEDQILKGKIAMAAYVNVDGTSEIAAAEIRPSSRNSYIKSVLAFSLMRILPIFRSCS